MIGFIQNASELRDALLKDNIRIQNNDSIHSQTRNYMPSFSNEKQFKVMQPIGETLKIKREDTWGGEKTVDSNG